MNRAVVRATCYKYNKDYCNRCNMGMEGYGSRGVVECIVV